MIIVTSIIERILDPRAVEETQGPEDITVQEVMKKEVSISEKTSKDETPNRLDASDRQIAPDGSDYPAVPEDTKVDEVKADQ